jgi:hypothetical protein
MSFSFPNLLIGQHLQPSFSGHHGDPFCWFLPCGFLYCAFYKFSTVICTIYFPDLPMFYGYDYILLEVCVHDVT